MDQVTFQIWKGRTALHVTSCWTRSTMKAKRKRKTVADTSERTTISTRRNGGKKKSGLDEKKDNTGERKRDGTCAIVGGTHLSAK